jgi:hypothetical protein
MRNTNTKGIAVSTMKTLVICGKPIHKVPGNKEIKLYAAMQV